MKTSIFTFPGQGSQSLGMLADIAKNYPEILVTFQEASDALGYDVWKLIQQGPVDRLNQTEYTQPAILATSMALYRLVSPRLDAPKFMAGHSLGEYTALVAADVVDFADALQLVQKRGQYMQQAVPEGIGAMAAIIGLDDQSIIEACQSTALEQVVQAVNFNSPGQVVIAGNKEAVERAMVLCKEKGAKRALPLPVSVPSHCSLMIQAAEKLALDLANLQFRAPKVPVINNVNVTCPSDPSEIKEALRMQLFSPVRWTETIAFAHQQAVETCYECGPGKVLTGLSKRIVKGINGQHLGDLSGLSAIQL